MLSRRPQSSGGNESAPRCLGISLEWTCGQPRTHRLQGQATISPVSDAGAGSTLTQPQTPHETSGRTGNTWCSRRSQECLRLSSSGNAEEEKRSHTLTRVVLRATSCTPLLNETASESAQEHRFQRRASIAFRPKNARWERAAWPILSRRGALESSSRRLHLRPRWRTQDHLRGLTINCRMPDQISSLQLPGHAPKYFVPSPLWRLGLRLSSR